MRIVIDDNRHITVNGATVSRYPDLKPLFVDMPKPDYPLELRRRHLTGSGIFRMQINEDGTVEPAGVCKTTGHQELDAQVVKVFSRWRAKPGTRGEIDFPVTFSMTSAARPAPTPYVPPQLRSKIRVMHDDISR